MKFQVDSGAIEEIKRLKEVAKCPFCGEQLKFQRYEKSWRDPRITLRCETCNLDFEFQREEEEGFLDFLGRLLGKKPERNWMLTKVEKTWR